jgi:hypothetical protein
MNMKDWKVVTGTQLERPLEVDRNSSPTTVYLRRNITQIEQEMKSGETVKMWQYEECEMTVAEYENMVLMQQVVAENASEIVDSVTQFQKDEVIDEYTQELIEEGLI